MISMKDRKKIFVFKIIYLKTKN
ncbi:unnamed protein product [Acanthoscelides obtectus]|uniref:Uncharacterized protein n=1 Tax=Acanthoscelides obtectus TaxID=200917 RepID=A0A9P0JYX9_ACAOB|nr:unnamed protein product [Acanthoscelides obtectus]CAK1633762.1 hypothetical protein AOBTE_LOCUS8373 [Acanthoscelides obtectus]